MKTYPAGYLAGLQAGGAQVCFLYTITLNNGVMRYFTDFASDVTVGGHTYLAGGGVTRSALSLTNGLDTSNVDITFLLTPTYINKSDVKAGLYQGALITINEVQANNVSLGTMQFIVGNIGEAKLKRVEVVYTIHSIIDHLNTKAARVTAPNCEWKLGDPAKGRCQYNIATVTVSNAVSGVVDNQTFDVGVVLNVPSTRVFNFGTVTFTSGLNAGLSQNIKSAVAHTGFTSLVLWNQMPYAVAITDTLTIAPGCDHLTATCNGDFNNIGRYGGQPQVPGEIKANNGVQ